MQDQSFGIIPLMRQGESWEVLLTQHREGHWAFPKGHAEGMEQPKETALRELREETGLVPTAVWEDTTFEERYTFQKKGMSIEKTVLFFVGEIAADQKTNVKIQPEEVNEARWVPLSAAENLMTFPAGKQIARQLQTAVERKKEQHD